MVIWPQVAAFLIIGYLSMTRSFAYLGIPQLQLFIGEIVLAAFLVLKPRAALGTWIVALLRPSPLSTLSLALFVFMTYGVWQALRGVMGGDPVLHVLKFLTFNYYAIYLTLGIWIGIHAYHLLPRIIHVLAWVNGIYALMWLSVLKSMEIYIPGSTVSLFGLPSGGPVAIVGLLCFTRNPRTVWPVLALNVIVTLGVQQRSQWLGLAVGALVWGLCTGRLGRLVGMAAIGLAALAAVEFSGVQLGVGGRTTSFAEVISRAVAPIDKDLARQFSPHAQHHAGTMEWREKWWDQIWISAHSTPTLEAFGHGYGFDLFGLAPASVRAGQDAEVRTPHSVFYHALGYTGWVGVVLFAALQLSILQLLWRAFRVDGRPAGVAFWAIGIAMACFEASFETPYKAIPFYLLAGITMAPAFHLKAVANADPPRSQLLPVAGR